MTDGHLREPPAERFDEPVLKFDLKAEAAAIRAEPAAAHQGHRQKALFKNGARTIGLFVMDEGGALPQHAAAGTVTVQAIEGKLLLNVAGQEHRLEAGDLLVMHPGVLHDVRAATAAVFLLQVSLGS